VEFLRVGRNFWRLTNGGCCSGRDHKGTPMKP
jgi:hypothetical protein